MCSGGFAHLWGEAGACFIPILVFTVITSPSVDTAVPRFMSRISEMT